ncbi:MAG: type II toxin-antitoxin system RelE/ParE family toxin [Acinetobacter sp.]|jgi:toxin ParE1/3/4
MDGMQFKVEMTRDATEDLRLIYEYIADEDGISRANDILDKVLVLIDDLSSFPQRSVYPKELIALGIQEYRQVIIYSYRVIYRIFEQQVIIYLIVDGRRDLQTVLAKRLLAQ